MNAPSPHEPPAASAAASKPNPWVEIIVSIVVPSLVLMKLSGDDRLGPALALVVALAFPLLWGLWELKQRRKFGLIPALGVVSTLLTGGIGLLQLDAKWLAVKEAAIPGVIGLVVLASTWTRYPLVRALVYNETVMDLPLVQRRLEEHHAVDAFEARLRRATQMLAGTFFFSSVMNYVLARWIVTSASGTEAFNEELGRMTLMSYPMIALPSTAMMVGVLYYLTRGLKELTGLTLAEVMRQPGEGIGKT